MISTIQINLACTNNTQRHFIRKRCNLIVLVMRELREKTNHTKEVPHHYFGGFMSLQILAIFCASFWASWALRMRPACLPTLESFWLLKFPAQISHELIEISSNHWSTWTETFVVWGTISSVWKRHFATALNLHNRKVVQCILTVLRHGIQTFPSRNSPSYFIPSLRENTPYPWNLPPVNSPSYLDCKHQCRCHCLTKGDSNATLSVNVKTPEPLQNPSANWPA